jgi:hypothetical protein
MHALVNVGLPNGRLVVLIISQRIRASAHRSQSTSLHVSETCRILQCMGWANYPKIWNHLRILGTKGWHEPNSVRLSGFVKLLKQISQVFCNTLFVHFWRDDPQWARAPSFRRFLDQTQRRTTVGRTPLDEWSAHRKDLYLTKTHTHNRKTSMPPVGIEPQISAGERQQTYALDRAATGTDFFNTLLIGNAQSDDVTYN